MWKGQLYIIRNWDACLERKRQHRDFKVGDERTTCSGENFSSWKDKEESVEGVGRTRSGYWGLQTQGPRRGADVCVPGASKWPEWGCEE